MQLSGGALNRKLHCGRCPVSHELDTKVLESVEVAKRNCQRPVNDQEVLQIARDMGKELGIAGFKPSGSWLRRWKCRCEAVKDVGEPEVAGLDTKFHKRCSENEAHEHRTNGDTLCHQLTVLSDAEKVCSVQLDKSGKGSGCESSGSVSESAASCMEYTTDHGTPEHNYSMGLASKPLANGSNCHSPNLKSNVAELLENVALLQAHEQGNLVGLEGGNERNHMHLYDSCSPEKSSRENLSVENGESQSDLNQSCFLGYTGLGDSHDYPCSNSPASLLEEEQFMSVFNHRSFTDPFPFLPPSYVCFPPENLHSFSTDSMGGMGIDDLLHEAQMLDTASKRMRKKKTRSGKSTSGNDPGSLLLSNTSSTGSRQASGSHSPSLCLDHWTSLSHSGLMTSPTYPNGLSSSPPGGLLANRRSQPVFPDEPEIVFHELQLGSLHTTPTQ